MNPLNPIATRTTEEGTFIFVEQEDTQKIYAQIPNAEPLVPVSLPEETEMQSVTAAKIQNLLQSCYWQPVYEPETNQVKLKALSPPIEKWTEKAYLPLSEEAITLCRADGKVSYAVANTLFTWDWETDSVDLEYTVKNGACITALAEGKDGSLIIGDEKGQLHVSGRVIPTGYDKSIEAIQHFHDSWGLIKYKYETEDEKGETVTKIGLMRISFTLGEKDIVSSLSLLPLNEKSCVLSDGTRALLDESTKKVQWRGFDQATGKFTKKLGFKVLEEGIEEVRLFSEMKLLFVHQDKKTLTLYDKHTGKSYKWEDHELWWRVYCESDSLSWLDNQTIAVGGLKGSVNSLKFYYESSLGKEPLISKRAGTWAVIKLLPLADGSIMHVTNTTPSGIHVVTREGEIAFSRDLEGNPVVTSLSQLANGFVAVKTSYPHSIRILQPHIKENKVAGSKEPEFASSLASLEGAFKRGDFYKARRFYKQAKKLQADSDVPSQISLIYLKRSLNKKLYRELLLELFSSQTKKEVSNNKLKNEITQLKDKPCKKRLFVGEGTFSFTEAFITKHQFTHTRLASSIVATELAVPAEKKQETLERAARLRERGVTVLFGIDAQTLHSHPFFKGKRFKRIHWNCPFTKEGVSQDKFRHVIPNFFSSCVQLQQRGDRIHVSLMQEKEGDYWKKRQIENPIVLGATQAGYRLIRKRQFGSERYPDYQHAKTSGAEHSSERQREFVFEKTDRSPIKLEDESSGCKALLKRAEALKDPNQKEYKIKKHTKNSAKPSQSEGCYFDCSTDEDSSDGYDSD
ncbi:class I SAM-dependent methyltransferase [Parachlamydia sp. AcF125]|uniref:class I SAM-dependent methyltransferase n=1 Tax=Parachlamydia sp. AcF125 TaxID=2795736 RepID=UPI001BC98640|nr:class I SAM-dependent methyltransferase [Parachlamydia sp. AcF125]MBS4168047.1 hypothetical protein [Parachlamydia sp. AcF125]